MICTRRSVSHVNLSVLLFANVISSWKTSGLDGTPDDWEVHEKYHFDIFSYHVILFAIL